MNETEYKKRIEDLEHRLNICINKINDHLDDLRVNYNSAFEEIKTEIEELKKEQIEEIEILPVPGIYSLSSANFDCFKNDDCHISANPKKWNQFQTKEEAEMIANRFRAYLKLRRIAEILNNGWEPDWNDTSELKYYVFFNCFEEAFTVSWQDSFIDISRIYFQTRELAQKALGLMGEDMEHLK
jgi:hypothetical protein